MAASYDLRSAIAARPELFDERINYGKEFRGPGKRTGAKTPQKGSREFHKRKQISADDETFDNRWKHALRDGTVVSDSPRVSLVPPCAN